MGVERLGFSIKPLTEIPFAGNDPSSSVSDSENSRPKISRTRSTVFSAAESRETSRPSITSVNETEGFAIAATVKTFFTWPSSVVYDLRNFLLAGTLQKRSRASTVVPGGHPAVPVSSREPALTTRRKPSSDSLRRVVIVKRDTDAIEGIASPRKPNVFISSMSSTSKIFEVACRSRERSASSRVMPHPSSCTATSLRPPCAIVTLMLRAPASSAFSINSFTMDAGRSTTSPAAILFAT